MFFVSEDGLSQMKTKRREQTETSDELLKQDDKYIHILQKQIEFPKPYILLVCITSIQFVISFASLLTMILMS